MGCVVGKPLLASSPPADVPKDNPSEDAASTPQTLLDSTKGITQDESQPDSQGTALLTLAMGVDTSKVIGETVSVKPGDDDAQLGGDGSSGNVLKSRVHQSILGDPQPEDAPPSMLPDVSYSMRDGPAQSVAINPNDGLNQPTNPVSSARKAVGLQPMQPRQSLQGPMPLQQPQVARAPGWTSAPVPRGRGGYTSTAPGGYRVPPQPVGGPNRASTSQASGRGRPIHAMTSNDRQRLPFPVVGNAQDSSPSKPLGGGKADNTDSSSDEAEDADDDEDLDDDEEEVEDWDLDDGDEKSKPENPAKLKLDSAKNGHPTPSPSKRDSLQPHQVQATPAQYPPKHAEKNASTADDSSPPPRRRSSGFQPKFRPALELTDDIEAVESDSDDSSEDSDDDDAHESGDEIEDWLDGPQEPAPTNSPPWRTISPPKLVPSALEIPQPSLSAQSPQSTRQPSRQMYGLSIVPPVNGGSANNSVAGSGSPQRAPQPPPFRQGNMSPTRSAGPNFHMSHSASQSPVKQPSYRSGIMNNVAPVLIPLVMTGDQSPCKSAPSPGPSSPSAAIRDTKVVKKKKAELPQHNLPHPVPKFGDWLNSRTMINNYIILEQLGAGGYAEVKLCKEKLSGKLFAMKFISRDVMKKDKLGKQSKLDDIKREIAIMKKLNHPNVLRLYEVMDDPKMNKLFLVLEYMKHGDMLSYQKKKHPQGMLENLRDRDLHSVFLQVILGLAYLHEQKIVHGDIKPQNLLVGEKDVVKIGDFGISQSLYGSKQKIADVAGTPAFMSPEMCSGEEYSGQLADVWALGATIFMLKFGNPPFLAKSALQMFERIQHDPLVFPGAIDPLLAHLLNGMLTKIPQKRLTLLDVMTHPWITKNEKHKLPLGSFQPESQITVSKDEIEHAVGANHIVLLMNIRKQMLKSLKRARERLAVRNAAQTQTVSTEWDTSSKLVFAQSPKARNLVKTNKILAANSDPILITDAEKGSTFEDRRVLSNEEIDYRSQLFSRKKPSNKNALEMASGGTGDVSRRGSLSAQAQTIAQVLSDGLDDDDALSDEDDELAVSQSPQLLDELLLTTLSMPPLTKTAGDPVHMPSLFVSRSEAGSNKKPGSSGLLSIGSRSSTSIANVGRSTGSSDDQRFYGKSPALSVHYGVSSLQGRRSTQEDRWVVFPTVSAVLDCGNGPSIPWTTETAYVGIYDGHGGEECANILYDQLHTWIFRSLESSSLSCKDLQECFETLDASVCDYLLHKDDLSGSTATSVVFRKAGDGKLLLTFAHVGDCRLVLSKRDGRTVELTQDHRLTLETERDRVIQLGGRVVNNRVNGVMAITRAFGDLEFKGMLGRHHSTRSSTGSESFGRGFREDEKVPPLLTAKPDVHDVELDANEDAFLILACDGLWDVITSEEAAEILRDRIRLHGDLQLAAHELAQEGIRRYSNDNITVIAMLLQSPELIALHGS